MVIVLRATEGVREGREGLLRGRGGFWAEMMRVRDDPFAHNPPQALYPPRAQRKLTGASVDWFLNLVCKDRRKTCLVWKGHH